MTIPRERKNALKMAREFLRDLLNPKKTPKVPKKIRQDAYWCLKHYPAEYEIDKLAELAPKILGDDEL